MSIKDNKPEKGIWSPEIPTGDLTILPGSKSVAVAPRNDFLIDSNILLDSDYTQGSGAFIHDFKELKNLVAACCVIDNQDQGMKLEEDNGDNKKDDTPSED